MAHNAPFDVGFMDYEFELANQDVKHHRFVKLPIPWRWPKDLPGKRNNLDILCDRYGIDNSHRTLHGALLDAEILADVYLLMTGGQTAMQFNAGQSKDGGVGETIKRVTGRKALKVLKATDEELQQHEERLDLFAKRYLFMAL